MKINELANLEPIEFIREIWGENVIEAIRREPVHTMSIEEFLSHCTACGGNWCAMLLTGIKEIWPNVWEAIPDDMGHFSWQGLCNTLLALGVTMPKGN